MLGVHQLPPEQYHADPMERPSMSSTLGREILFRSPLHAWTMAPRLNPEAPRFDSAAFKIGRAAHREALGAGADWVTPPEDLLSPDGGIRSKDAKAWRDEQEAQGLTVIKADIAAQFDNMPAGRRYFVDYKTSRNPVTPEQIQRSIQTYGYDFQVAHYQDVWESATGERRTPLFIFQETSAPYGVQVARLMDDESAEDDFMTDARSKVREARRLWAECLETGVWPGYPASIALIGAKHWHKTTWADREVGVSTDKPSQAARVAAYKLQAP